MPPSPRRETLENTNLDDLLAARFTYADIAHRLGDLDGARALVCSVLGDDRIAANTGFLFRFLWVAARIQTHDVDEGTWVAERIRHLIDLAPPTNPRDRAYAAHACADLAGREGTDSPELWDQVVDGWRAVGQPFELATALVRAAVAHVAAGRPDEARDQLREAAAIAERLGARPLAEEVGAVARQAHLRLSVATAEPAAGLGLTPRELDVLRLVAEGATNPAIAAKLFISPKTASVHVSNILAKLEVSNRGEAAALAHRSGIVPTVGA